jgi:predicted phosphoribosyltransferase
MQRGTFTDRADAARQLAAALSAYRGMRPLVLAIPRGAVPMARIIADALDGELDVVLVRKLGAPGNPELAVGAMDETGWVYVAPWADAEGAGADYLEREKARQMATLRRRRAEYTPGRAPIDPAGRTVIVVDDGLATGATMIAALHAVRAREPARLVCAVPVGAPSSIEKVRPYCDEVVVLHAPELFHAVGQFYRVFDQVEDDEVIALLNAAARRPAADSR